MLTHWLFGTAPAGDLAAILLLALALDAAVGDPAWFYRLVPHPVAAIGRLIEVGERRLNDPAKGRRARAARGFGFAFALVAAAAGFGWGVEQALGAAPVGRAGWILEAALASTLLAGRGLFDHVRRVADRLELGLEEARAAVAHIVGRDPESLDAPGVARAASESLAENFADAVVAPLFWFAVFGLAGLAAYKAVNTLDSMIGHRSDRFEAFGAAAARLDDALNWVPARLAGSILIAAAALLPGASARRAWRTMARDAPKHRSPNAGWPEAALAGALGFALAGPRQYAHGPVADRWMGDGRAALTAADLGRALRLYLVANAVLAAILAAGLAVAAV